MRSFNEIALIPARISTISSRKDVNPFTDDGKLPIFVAPMTCILDDKNYNTFNKRVYPILPWKENTDSSYFEAPEYGWRAISLQEFERITDTEGTLNPRLICVDVANGHMKCLYDLVPKFKNKNPNAKVMIGNIANPYTYIDCCEAGVDFVRIGIGGGSGCHKDGTMITMADGTKKAIEKINIGDFVKTLNGTGAVTSTIRYKTNNCLQINNSIVSTPNHKFLVIKKSDKDFVTEENLNNYAFYLEAEKLTSDYLLVQSV